MSYAAGESVDLVKSSVGGGNGSTALLDASLANDSSQEWEAGNEEDSGSLLRKQKPILQQQQPQMVIHGVENRGKSFIQHCEWP